MTLRGRMTQLLGRIRKMDAVTPPAEEVRLPEYYLAPEGSTYEEAQAGYIAYRDEKFAREGCPMEDQMVLDDAIARLEAAGGFGDDQALMQMVDGSGPFINGVKGESNDA